MDERYNLSFRTTWTCAQWKLLWNFGSWKSHNREDVERFARLLGGWTDYIIIPVEGADGCDQLPYEQIETIGKYAIFRPR